MVTCVTRRPEKAARKVASGPRLHRGAVINLYTWATPTICKASIALGELDLDYSVHPAPLKTGAQKQPWFAAINPKGRIPAIWIAPPATSRY